MKGFGFGDVWGGTCKVKVHIGDVGGSAGQDSKPAAPSPSPPQPAGQLDKVKGRATCVLVPPARVKSVKNALEAGEGERCKERSDQAQRILRLLSSLPSQLVASLLYATNIAPSQPERRGAK